MFVRSRVFRSVASPVESLRQHLSQLRNQFMRSQADGNSVTSAPLAQALITTEAQLVLQLAHPGSTVEEEQREALIRGEELWRRHAGQLSAWRSVAPLPSATNNNTTDALPSKEVRYDVLCSAALRRCALKLRDAEAAQIWASRHTACTTTTDGSPYRGGGGGGTTTAAIETNENRSSMRYDSSHLPPAMSCATTTVDASASGAGEVPPQAAAPGWGAPPRRGSGDKNHRRPSTPHAPMMGIAGYDDVDEDDDIGGVSDTPSSSGPNRCGASNEGHARGRGGGANCTDSKRQGNGTGMSPDDPVEDGPLNATTFGTNDDGNLSPSERSKRNVLRMMASQQKRQQQKGAGGGVVKNGSGGRTSIEAMRHRMMTEDHPMVEAIFRKPPQSGPRWT